MCGNRADSATRSSQSDERILAEAGAAVVRAGRDNNAGRVQTTTNVRGNQTTNLTTTDAGTVKLAGEIAQQSINVVNAAQQSVAQNANQSVTAISTFAGESLNRVSEALGVVAEKDTGEAVAQAVLPVVVIFGLVAGLAIVRGGK